MYLEERLERLEKALEKRLDTLERLTDERCSEIENDLEQNERFISATQNGTFEAAMKLQEQIIELRKRIERLETPTLFTAEASKK